MTQLTNDIYAVELTNLGDQYKSFRILPPDHVWIVPYLKYSYRSIYHTKRRGSDFYCSEEDPLEPGNWQLICTTKECTEEQAKELVKELPVGARWYNYNGDYPVWWHSAKESLRSLVTSKGLDPDKTLIIKKVS